MIDLNEYRAEREDLNHRVALCMYEMLGKPPGVCNQKLADILALGVMTEDSVADLEAAVRRQSLRAV